jgi:hypothetical protein
MCEYNRNTLPNKINDPNNYKEDFKLELLSRDNVSKLLKETKVFYIGVTDNEFNIKKSGDFEKIDFSKLVIYLDIKGKVKEYSMKEYFFYFSLGGSVERGFMVDLLKALETGKIKKRDKSIKRIVKKKKSLNF